MLVEPGPKGLLQHQHSQAVFGHGPADKEVYNAAELRGQQRPNGDLQESEGLEHSI